MSHQPQKSGNYESDRPMGGPFNSDVSRGESAPPSFLDWSALLAHWTTLAQASVALPADGDGGRWRESIAGVIGLQALVCALGDIDRLSDPADRPLAVDRAEVLVRRHAGELNSAWQGEPMPEGLGELVQDARAALEGVRSAGVEWLFPQARGRSSSPSPSAAATLAMGVLSPHPGELVDVLIEMGFGGDLYLPAPGVWVFAPAPVAFGREAPSCGGGGPRDDGVLELITGFLADAVDDPTELMMHQAGQLGAGSKGKQAARGSRRSLIPVPTPAGRYRQVYRQFDFARGGPVRDFVVPEHHTLPPGQPLLVPAIIEGVPQPVSLPPRTTQAFAAPLPVEFEGTPEGGGRGDEGAKLAGRSLPNPPPTP